MRKVYQKTRRMNMASRKTGRLYLSSLRGKHDDPLARKLFLAKKPAALATSTAASILLKPLMKRRGSKAGFGALFANQTRVMKKLEMKRENLSLSGEKVAAAGVYEVNHSSKHRKPHEVVLLAGQVFPECEQCREQRHRVSFRLVREAPYLFDDPDFHNMSAKAERHLKKG
jgi:hypothetical protein